MFWLRKKYYPKRGIEYGSSAMSVNVHVSIIKTEEPIWNNSCSISRDPGINSDLVLTGEKKTYLT